MIYINTDINEKIKGWNKENTYVIADFDETLTSSKTSGTWELLSEGNLFSDEYKKIQKEMYNYYRPLESDQNINKIKQEQLMYEWWQKHLALLIKYQLDEEKLKTIIKETKDLQFREGAIDFLKFTHNNNIPIIIMSAGIRNIIIEFLKNNNCDFDNIITISNNLIFKDKKAINFSNNIIHTHNKSEIVLFDETKKKIAGRNNRILLGNVIADVKMLNEDHRKKALKIGYLTKPELLEEYKKVYDIVATDDTSYNEIRKLINF